MAKLLNRHPKHRQAGALPNANSGVAVESLEKDNDISLETFGEANVFDVEYSKTMSSIHRD